MAVVGAPAIGLFAFVASCGLAGPKRILVSDGQGGTMKNLFLRVLSREWMGMGEWDDYY